ncbi:hypothetical protein BaRGS_00002845, partial [Batillaria attramentaria]
TVIYHHVLLPTDSLGVVHPLLPSVWHAEKAASRCTHTPQNAAALIREFLGMSNNLLSEYLTA